MKILLLDTSTDFGLIAICDDEKVLYSKILREKFENSRLLLPEIKIAFDQLQIEVKDLDLIAVTNGPGSYTGLRVAAIVGKTISYALKIPLCAICSLHVYTPEDDGAFTVVFDAKISGLYTAFGNKVSNTIFWQEASILSLEDARETLKDQKVLSPQATTLNNKLKGSLQLIEKEPDAQTMAKQALKKFEVKNFSTDGSLEMNYMRKTQAEIERDEKKLAP